MANTSGAIRAGRAFVEFFADGSKLEAAMKRIETRFKAFGSMTANFGKGLMAAGLAVLGPLAAISKLAGAMGEQFGNMAKRTGISVEALTALDYVASQTGTSIESLESGIKKMQKALVDAADGSKEPIEALKVLGLTIAELQGLKPDEQFKLLADRIKNIEDPSLRAAMAMKLFGKGGVELLPMLSQGSVGINDLMKRAEELGLVLSTEGIQAAGDFNDKLSELWLVVRAAGFNIASVLLPALTTAINSVEKLVAGAAKWIGANKELVVWTLAVGAGLVAAGAGLLVFGTALTWGIGVITAIGSAIAAVWGLLTAIGGGIAAVVTSPLLATIVVVGALTGAFGTMAKAGGAAIDWLGERFGVLRDFASEAFRGIANALIAGDIKLAAEILWKTLELAWKTGVNELEKIWLTLKMNAANIWAGMVNDISAGWQIFTSFLTEGMVRAIASLKNAWTEFASWFRTAVLKVGTVMAIPLIAREARKDMQEQFDGVLSKDQAAKLRDSYGIKGVNAGDTLTNEQLQRVIDIEKDRRREDLDRSLTGEQDAINREMNSQFAQIEADKKSQLDMQKKDHQARMQEIEQQYNKDIAAASEAFAKGMTKGTEELTRLQADFAALMAQAKAKRDMAAANPLGITGLQIPDLTPGIAAAKESTFGSFSAAAANAGAKLSNDHMLAIRRATEATAANTAKTASLFTPGAPLPGQTRYSR